MSRSVQVVLLEVFDQSRVWVKSWFLLFLANRTSLLHCSLILEMVGKDMHNQGLLVHFLGLLLHVWWAKRACETFCITTSNNLLLLCERVHLRVYRLIWLAANIQLIWLGLAHHCRIFGYVKLVLACRLLLDVWLLFLLFEARHVDVILLLHALILIYPLSNQFQALFS